MTVVERIVAGVRFWIERCFTLDLRSLALFRIGLGALIVIDVATRARDAEVFLSDRGVVQSAGFLQTLTSRPSLYQLDGGVGFQLALLFVTGLCAVVFAVGWHTRIFSIVCWALLLSVQNRNGHVLTGADGVMIALTTWACLLPVGARFSLDARRRPDKAPAHDTVVSWASAAFVLQMITIYFFNVVNKNTAAWWRGNAVMIALQIDEHATMIGVFVREHLKFLAKPLTWGTIVAESVPLVLLVPFRNDVMRFVSIATLWGLHIGFALCMWLGLFSPACMVGWLALLPSRTWLWRPFARLAALLSRHTPAPTRTSSGARWGMWLTAPVVIALVWVQIGSNLGVSFGFGRPPRALMQVGAAMRMQSTWKMFGSPGVNDGWWVVPGTLASGRQVDLFRDVYDPVEGGAPVSFDKPDSVAHTYPTARWRKYMMSASGQPQTRMRKQLARWFCRTWNETHAGDDALVKLEMIYVLEKTSQSARVAKPKQVPMLEHTCEAGS